MAPTQVMTLTQCYVEEIHQEVHKNAQRRPCASTLTSNQAKRQRVQGSEEEITSFTKPKCKNFIGQNLNICDYYFQGPELGRGTYGVAFMCADKNSLGEFACKSIVKNHVDFDMDDLQLEVAIMEHLPLHSNLVALKGAYDDDIAVHLVMELCEGGELATRIENQGHYTEHGAANVIRTVMEVVKICHMHGVMHRDLKAENFLFVTKDEDSPLKAIDFGMSVFFKPGERFSQFAGTLAYMAPEVYKEDYGPEVDIWSAGVILYMLLCGEFPFNGDTTEELKNEILYGDLDLWSHEWKKVSPTAKSLVRHMLERDPKFRYSAQQVLDHQWLQMHADIKNPMCKRRKTL